MEQEANIVGVSPGFASPDVLRFIDFLRKRLSWDQQVEVALALDMCLECGGSLRHLNSEVVCERCGLVWREDNSEKRIPFPEFDDAVGDGHYEMHWNPECSLAFARGLGTSMGSRSLAQILKRGSNGETVVSRRLLRMLSNSNHESAFLMNLLARVSFLLDKFGLRGNHVAAEHAGRLMRRAYFMAQQMGIRLSPSIADAVVAYTLYIFKVKRYEPKMLNLRKKDITLIKWYIKMEKEARQMRQQYNGS